MRPERDVDAQAVAITDEVVAALRADAVEHLKLVLVGGGAALGDHFFGADDQLLVVGRDPHIAPLAEQPLDVTLPGNPTSFGQDLDGELYVLTADGVVGKLVAGS